MAIAYIGLGSNMGDKAGNINKAIAAIEKIQGIKVLAVSSFYRTEPVGDIVQDWFINAATRIETSLTPKELLKVLMSVEQGLGRIREIKWGPRVIDLDILLYDDLVINEEGLLIPHPLMIERRFVLRPLAEIAPGVIHPGTGKTIKEILSGSNDTKKVERIGG